MVENKYKILIPTSGIGSRMSQYTKCGNKALLKVGDEAAISKIIGTYPRSRFVITLGHNGQMVRDYIELAHKKEKSRIEFVEVDKYSGPGSSLLYSIYCAKDKLQQPFILHVCDSIVDYEIPIHNVDWTLSYDVRKDFSQYRSPNNSIENWNIHTGVAGIFNYERFWSIAEKLLDIDPENEMLNDLSVLNLMAWIQTIQCENWFDTGNVKAYEKTALQYKSNHDVLPKFDENIYFRDATVIKLFHNKTKVKNLLKRIKKGKFPINITPELLGKNNHGFSYKFVKGLPLSETVTALRLNQFLDYCIDNFWTTKPFTYPFRERCRQFYLEKTRDRIASFLNGKADLESEVINGISVSSVYTMLDDLERLDEIFLGTKSPIHGDMVLDNIIDTGSGFTFIDWRERVFDDFTIGDIYYDFAKLSHSTILKHNLLNSGLCKIKKYDNSIYVEPIRDPRLIRAEKALIDWMNSNLFSVSKMKVIRSLIWLSMAPLHPEPIGSFLFYWGKLNLYSSMSDITYERNSYSRKPAGISAS